MIRIRLGTPHDLVALEHIELETAPMFSPDDLPPALAVPLPVAQLEAGVSASLLWVAEEERSSTPIGFVLCERPPFPCLHIREMDVRPSFGRRGIGAKLLLHVCEYAKTLGLPFVTLTTFSHLPWNAPFYAKYGFRIASDWESYAHLPAILEHERTLGLRNRVAMVRSAD
jgi:GNAT superfamily N-acetyltransferase